MTTQKLMAFAYQLMTTPRNDGDTTNYDNNRKQTVDTHINTNHTMIALDNLEVNVKLYDENRMNTKKARRHDKISNKIISYHLPPLTLILLILYSHLVFRCHYPTVWKRGTSLNILKPNKRKSDPGSFRPISRLCNFGKVSP